MGSSLTARVLVGLCIACSLYLGLAPPPVVAGDPFQKTYGEIVGEQMGHAITEFLAYQQERKKALPRLRAARGLLWACGNCPQRDAIEDFLQALLDDRDILIATTHRVGVRPSPWESGIKQSLYGSPYGEVTAKCRSKFDNWADCLKRKGVFASFGACPDEFDVYKSCRDTVELEEHLPSFPPSSTLGQLAFRSVGQSRYDSLASYEALYLAAMKIDNWTHNFGRGVVYAAAREALEQNTTDPLQVVEKFVTEQKAKACSNRFQGRRTYEKFLSGVQMDEFGMFDRDEAEQWLADVVSVYGAANVERELLIGYEAGFGGRARERLLHGLPTPQVGVELTRKDLVARLKKDPKTANLIPPVTDEMLFGDLTKKAKSPGPCEVKARIATAHEKDPVYERFVSIWQDDYPTAGAEDIGLWIDLYNNAFGESVVRRAIRELLEQYDKEQSKDAHSSREPRRKWFIHTQLLHNKLLPIAAAATASGTDLSGEYRGEGIAPDGQGYEVAVELRQTKPAMYSIQWIRSKETVQSSGLLHNGKLIVWTTGAPTVYTVQADGDLSGQRSWSVSGHGPRVNERLTRKTDQPPTIAGTFRVSGVIPAGSAYKGTCVVSQQAYGDVYEFQCRKTLDSGITRAAGRGQLVERKMTVQWRATRQVSEFLVDNDGSMNLVSDNERVWEKLEPVSGSKVAPTISELQGKYHLSGEIHQYGGSKPLPYNGRCVIWSKGDKYLFQREVPGTLMYPKVLMVGEATVNGDTLIVTLPRKEGGTASLHYRIGVDGRLSYTSANKRERETCVPPAFVAVPQRNSLAGQDRQSPPNKVSPLAVPTRPLAEPRRQASRVELSRTEDRRGSNRPKWGAMGVGNTREWFYTTNQESQRQAMLVVQKECRRRCDRIVPFRDRCGALAVGDRGYGYGRDETEQQVKAKAMGYCQRVTTNCSVVGWACSK